MQVEPYLLQRRIMKLRAAQPQNNKRATPLRFCFAA